MKNRRILSRIGRLLIILLVTALVLLSVGPTLGVSAQDSRPVACVTARALNVRSGPGVSYPVISALLQDQCVTLAGYRNAEATWVLVRLPGGGTGWVSAYYIQTSYRLTDLAIARSPSPTVPAQPAAPPAAAWRGEYYPNVDLVGSPALVRNDERIDFVWGWDAPAAGLPADNFSVRWARSAQFESGTYRFYAAVDDGVRLYVDGALVIDGWYDGARRQITGDRALTAGSHNIRVEYYERGRDALIQVWWERIGAYAVSFSEWRGEYYANRDFWGAPRVVRNDPYVDFNWGLGAPAPGVPADDFSVRWTRSAQFDGGTYRFHTLVDDGVRLWVDGQLIIDAWQDSPARELVADRALSSGTHTVRVEYYERSGFAQARVWWERIGASSSSFPDWKGEYFSNRSLSGSPTLVRNDKKLDFDWDGRPASGLPKDNFSVRWNRTTKFDAATYRFYALVDDGVRLWVDGRRIIDAWEDGPARQVAGDYTLLKGDHTVRVEYYDHEGDARIKVWWEKVTPTFSGWKGEYFSNRELRGDPKLVRNDSQIDFNWKGDSPAKGLSSNDFSVRWTREVEFAPSTYRFYAQADDGIRVYLDGTRILDQWHESSGDKVYQVDRALEGRHQLMVEYYERSGSARVRFWWENVTPTFTEWKGEYFSNRKLQGSPTLVRNDRVVDFSWREGRPAQGLPEDNFSVRWTRELDFASGTYRFYAQADDGVRVYIDGTRILDEWRDSSGKTVYQTTRTLEGKHRLTVEYYERAGSARIKFWWEKL